MIQQAATDGSSWGLKKNLLTEMLWNRHCRWTNPFHFSLPDCCWQQGALRKFLASGECQLHYHCIPAHLSLRASVFLSLVIDYSACNLVIHFLFLIPVSMDRQWGIIQLGCMKIVQLISSRPLMIYWRNACIAYTLALHVSFTA